MMRDLLSIATLSLVLAHPSHPLSFSDVIPDKMASTITRAGSSVRDASSAVKAVLPFETTYYTDYYYGDDKHKLYREVKEKVTGERLHCTYVGDREVIAGLIGDHRTKVNDALKGVLPTTFITAINATTEEVDQMIESCLHKPPNATETSKPGLKKFIDGLTGRAKHLASYLFIFPGTKWCGAGDVARNYDDLGPQNLTDMCCREHDHALDSINRGQTKHDLKNPLFYTITNCNDDGRFAQCLKDSHKAHASAVGTLYFNILKTKCFANRKAARCAKKLPLSPCQAYAYDENSQERYQVFDPVKYSPNSSVPIEMINSALFSVPGVDNLLSLF